MKRFRYILLALFAAISGVCAMQAARPAAKTVVETAVAKLRKAPSVKASFTVTNASGYWAGSLSICG